MQSVFVLSPIPRVAAIVLAIGLVACSAAPGKKEPKVFAAGEKATVGPLAYSVVDTQITPTLGDEAKPRTPQNLFVIVQVAVSNSGNEEVAIPGMTLVDDSGKNFPELADGTGISHWLGVLRKVAPAQTEQGQVLFDAPAKHYHLRLTEEGDEDVSVDIPLSFVHEQLRSLGTPEIH